MKKGVPSGTYPVCRRVDFRRLPIDRPQVELARTATLVPDLERKISLKENDIAYLAGEYPNKIARSRLLQEFNSPETLPVGLPSTLLERRPDIRQAEQKLIAANAKVGVLIQICFRVLP